jgi:hypothetical protein
MPLKTLIQPNTGRRFRMGRLRPFASSGPQLNLGAYLTSQMDMPLPPELADYSVAPAAYLKNVLGNDRAGDCTLAAAFHIAGALLANAGEPIPSNFSAAAALWTYYRLTGGQDSGLDEVTCLNYWRDRGLPLGKHRIIAWARVNATDVNAVKTALWLFENVYVVAECPDSWLNPMPDTDGFTWGMAGQPNPDNGHAFCSVHYEPDGIVIDTWGLSGKVPWDALSYYASPEQGGDLYTVLGADAIDKATAKAPNGFDVQQLMHDMDAITPGG